MQRGLQECWCSTCSISSKTEGSESAQIAYEVAKQFAIADHSREWNKYNDTRRWCCYETALLMKKNEIRTDEEAPLTTPVDASVLRYYRPSPEDRLLVARTIEGTENFLGKEKKHFSFSIKRNLNSSCSRIYSSIVKT